MRNKEKDANIIIVSDRAITMNYTRITSCSNSKIKEVLDIRRRKSTSKHASFVIEGPHLIEMALGAGASVGEVFFTEAFSIKKEGQKILKLLARHTGKMFEVADQVFHKLTETETPQGIIAVATHRPLSLKDLSLKENPLLIVSDGIQDPGNLGTIIRTADAAGVAAVIILPGTCDVYMPKTIRATAGSIFNIPIAYATVNELLDWIRFHRIKLVVTTADAGKTVFDAELDKPVAFVFGNEAHGVQEAVKKTADMVLSIPILGKAESLNVATSAAVCLYEAVRQRI